MCTNLVILFISMQKMIEWTKFAAAEDFELTSRRRRKMVGV